MEPATAHDIFFHVRVFIGIVTGLCVTRLLTGLARFVQHPDREKVYPIHLGWALFLLLSVIHFWWFEFGLFRIEQWTFEKYFFVIFYAVLFFFICAILFPDRMEEYSGFADYFHSRQRWFYALLSAIFVFDVIDSAMKGADHLRSFGLEYPLRQASLFALSVIAMFVNDRRYHAAFVIAALAYQGWWILRAFDVLT